MQHCNVHKSGRDPGSVLTWYTNVREAPHDITEDRGVTTLGKPIGARDLFLRPSSMELLFFEKYK